MPYPIETQTRAALAGALAGTVATWVMTQSANILSRILSDSAGTHERSSLDRNMPQDRDESATIKTARTFSKRFLDKDLQGRSRLWGGLIAHYGFGVTLGAVYGLLRSSVPQLRAGFGTAYGGAIWLGADEIAVPAIGLSDPLIPRPPRDHLHSLLAHFVYGACLEAATRSLTSGWRKAPSLQLERSIDHA